MILINPSQRNALRIFQPFFPLSMPPIGLGYLATALKNENINFRIIDEQIDTQAFSTIENYITNNEITKPYIFGFSILTAGYSRALQMAKLLKQKYPDSIILFGGIHPTAMPEESISFNFVDYVIVGEAEKTLPQFYKAIKNNKSCSDIKNLYYKDNKQILNTEREFLKDNLDNFPFPYDMFNNPKYDLNFIMSSRGCPYNCIFCSNRVTTGKPYRYRSADSIVEELEHLNKKYGKINIGFFDDNFLVNKRRIYQVIEKIKSKGLNNKMTFGFQARGDNVNKQLLLDLYDAGFKSIFFGIETASNQLLKTIKKGETIEKIIEGVQHAKEAKMNVSATFIFGLPGETKKDRIDSMKLSKKIKLDIVRFNNATPYPGTELFDIAKNEKRLFILGHYENFNSVSAVIENPIKPIPFSYVPSGISENEIRDDILWSYLYFYLDFSKIKNMFFKAEKSTGWFSPGKTLLEFFKKIPALLFLSAILSFKFIIIIIRRTFKIYNKIK